MKKLIPFDLQKALAGARVVTKGGFVVTDIAVLKGVTNGYPVVAAFDGKTYTYTTNGHHHLTGHSDNDLLIDVKQHWIGIFKNREGRVCFTNVLESEQAVMDVIRDKNKKEVRATLIETRLLYEE